MRPFVYQVAVVESGVASKATVDEVCGDAGLVRGHCGAVATHFHVDVARHVGQVPVGWEREREREDGVNW